MVRACLRTHWGVWGHAPPEKFLKLGALRSLLRPYLYANLYLDSMPLEYRARVFLERRSPCSGITEPSLHVFQRRGMFKKVTVPDSLKVGALKDKSLPRGGGGGHVSLVPPRFRRLCKEIYFAENVPSGDEYCTALAIKP